MYKFSREQVQAMLKLLPSEPVAPIASKMNLWFWDSFKTTFPEMRNTGGELIKTLEKFLEVIDNLTDFIKSKLATNAKTIRLPTKTITNLYFIKATHLANIQGLANPTQLSNGILPTLTQSQLDKIWQETGI